MLDKPQEKPATRPVDKKEPVVVKKYANRRLYNTETSTYVTLDDLAAMVRSERDFVVYDAKSGDDLTHSVLTQIIVEQESRSGGGQSMLPVPFLRQLIRFYGDSIGKMVPSYLQVSLDTLTREQARVREQFASAFTPAGALEVYQEQARKNLAMFEQAMAVFSPFAHGPFTKGATDASDAPAASPGVAAAAAALAAAVSPIKPAAETSAKHEPAKPQAVKPDDGELARMRSQLASMQATIDKLAKDRG